MATLEFCCSAHCGWSGTTGVTPTTVAVKHITSAQQPAQVSVVTLDGQPAWQMTQTAGGRVYLQRDYPVASKPAVAVYRHYVRYPGSLPNLSIGVVEVFIGALAYGVRFDTATSQLINHAGAIDGSAFTIAADTTYIVDVKVDVSGTNHLVDAKITPVGGSTTTLTQAVRSGIGAATLDDFRWGLGTVAGATVTGTVIIQKLALSRTAGDYPIGAGETFGSKPVADGTHVLNAVTDVKYNGVTDLASTTPTNLYTYLDDTPNNTTDFLALLMAAGEYIELVPQAMPSALTIHGVEAVFGWNASGTAANTSSAWLREGGTDGVVFDDADMSATALHVVSKHFATKPSGGAWTKTAWDAMRPRLAASRVGTPIISPQPRPQALVFEIDYIPAALQTITPDATVATGGWTVTGAATHHAAQADADPATYSRSPTNPSNATLKLGMQNFTPGTGVVRIKFETRQVP